MPARTLPRRESNRSLVTKVLQREVDDDARSDWTLDDSGFGAPLQRFQDPEDYGPRVHKPYDNDDRVSLLRRAQDQAWLQAQKEAAKAYLGPSFHDITADAQPFKRHVPSEMVTFKRIQTTSSELRLIEFLNSEQTREDPWNHSVPVLDVVDDDDEALIMMLKLRPFSSPPFHNVAECLDFTRQLLEGVAFFHEHKITHLNLRPENIGMDTGLLPITAANWDRSEHDVRYHIIDFSSARHFLPDETSNVGKCDMGTPGWMTGEMMELEQLSEGMPQDVKSLGTTLSEVFREHPELSFLDTLLCLMTARCPAARPTALEALGSLDEISAELPPEKLFEPIAAHMQQ
ncbi:hypothetical protein FRB90_002706 [Tulasnella sp. 427]|nr:hypothetical protein FRB90_002706 [Tulasnella sp. 427]